MTNQAPPWRTEPQPGQASPPHPGPQYQPPPGWQYPADPGPAPYPLPRFDLSVQPRPGRQVQPPPGWQYPAQPGPAPYPPPRFDQPAQPRPGPLFPAPVVPQRTTKNFLFRRAWPWVIVILAVCMIAGMARVLTLAVVQVAMSDVDVFEVSVGDCTGKFPGGEVHTIDLVPCDDKHHYEAYASMMMTGDAFPGEDEASQQAETFCEAEFAGFVGIPYDESKYVWTDLQPGKESWEFDGDREILCLAGDETGTIVGTLEGAKK